MMNERIQESDRELLELAAVAARINLDLTLRPDGKPLGRSERGLAIDEAPRWWNPLISDADALRLAVSIDRLDLLSVLDEYGDADFYNKNPLSAIRRAIVKAAAEIGRTMR